jgi:multisubunit Na+/H+ antiporter MnhC subunit
MENNTTVVVLGVTAIVLVLTYVIYKQMGTGGSSDSSSRFELQSLYF